MLTVETTSWSDNSALANRIVWALFDASKEQSLKFKIGPLPISIKIARLEPLVVKWVGTRP